MKNLPRQPIFTSLLIALVVFLASLLNPSPQQVQMQGLTGSITGRITAASDHLPRTGVSVCVYPNSGVGSFQCVTTGGNGSYIITGLPTGNYSIGVDQDGWAVEYYNQKYYRGGEDHLQVVAGQTLSGIDLELDPGASISGRVTDQVSGAPLAGVQVVLGGREEYFDCTDEEGNYSISGVRYEDGYYGGIYAEVNPKACPNSLPAYAQEYWQELPSNYYGVAIIFHRGSAVLEDFNFTLELGGSISGIVTSFQGGAALAGIPVCAETGSMPAICAVTGADGSYEITGLFTYNEYLVTVQADGWAIEYYNNTREYYNAAYVAVTAPEETTGINFTLDPDGAISGTVLDRSGNPVKGALVVGYHSTRTDDQGRYRIASIPNNASFPVTVWAIDERGKLLYAPQSWDHVAWDGTYIQLAGENPEWTDIDFDLEPLGAITGTVSASSGEPLADIPVCADGEHFNSSFLDRCAWTDLLGRYRLNLPHDYFRVYVMDRVGNYIYYDGGQVVVENGLAISNVDIITEPCFQASDGTAMDQVQLDWCPAAAADFFEVYRTAPGGVSEKIGTVPAAKTHITYADGSAEPGILYSYRVKACNASLCSYFSAPDVGWSNTWVGPGDYDDSFTLLGYGGEWDVLNGEPYSNGSLHVAQGYSARAFLFFNGTCISMQYFADSPYFRMNIYIDDVLVGEANQYLTETPMLKQTELFCVEKGIHVLKLAPYFSSRVNIDGIHIESEIIPYYLPMLR